MKEQIELGLMVCLCVAVLLFAAWHGMNKELCNRNYSQEIYDEMKLDCN